MQPGNQARCTDTCPFVGIGFPNALLHIGPFSDTRQSTFQNRCFSVEIRISTYDLFAPYGPAFLTRIGIWAGRRRPYDSAFLGGFKIDVS
ncbi:MAG: hypothetical protein OXI86_05920 [Candidatus Poribacteria bacterium]|nr:hypothetical protein [Candidatus Poribacteria bacterium]